MSNRTYRLILGTLLLIFLYFDQRSLILGLILITLAEGLSNLRIPLVVSFIQERIKPDFNAQAVALPSPVTAAYPRYNLEAERLWRLLFCFLLYTSYMVFGESLWFVPWFLGLAVFGAGVSGVCPMLYALRMFGFK